MNHRPGAPGTHSTGTERPTTVERSAVSHIRPLFSASLKRRRSAQSAARIGGAALLLTIVCAAAAIVQHLGAL